jgi:hypothetical protein
MSKKRSNPCFTEQFDLDKAVTDYEKFQEGLTTGGNKLSTIIERSKRLREFLENVEETSRVTCDEIIRDINNLIVTKKEDARLLDGPFCASLSINLSTSVAGYPSYGNPVSDINPSPNWKTFKVFNVNELAQIFEYCKLQRHVCTITVEIPCHSNAYSTNYIESTLLEAVKKTPTRSAKNNDCNQKRRPL